MKYIAFARETGQLLVDFSGVTFSLDVPIEDGAFITGEALRAYVEGFAPAVNVPRALALASGPSGAESIEAQCETVFSNEPTYAQLRAQAYPAVTEYLDAVVKGDEAQLQAYVQACLAVKERYPKPPELDDFQKRRLLEAL